MDRPIVEVMLIASILIFVATLILASSNQYNSMETTMNQMVAEKSLLLVASTALNVAAEASSSGMERNSLIIFSLPVTINAYSKTITIRFLYSELNYSMPMTIRGGGSAMAFSITGYANKTVVITPCPDS